MIDFNSVLMEPSCFLKPLICLENKEKISLKDFFNLSSLIESIILHNEIYTYGANRAYYKDKLPILRSLIDENIMYFFREDDYFFRKQLQDFYSPEIKNNQNNLNEKNKYYQNYSLFISNQHNLPYIPSIENANYILELYNIGQNRAIKSFILEHYKEIKKTFIKELELLKEIGKPIKIFIPPIMSIILSESTNYNDIFYKSLEMREKFKPLRDKFREYEIAIKDDTVSLGESYKIAKQLEKDFKILTEELKHKDSKILFEFADLFKDMPSEFFNIKEVNTSQIIKFILNKPVEWIIKAYRKRKLAYFISLKKKLSNIESYNALIKKTFGFDYTQDEIFIFQNKYKELIY